MSEAAEPVAEVPEAALRQAQGPKRKTLEGREGYVVPKAKLPDPEFDVLAATLLGIRTELKLPDEFPQAVERAAADAIESLVLPDRDLTDVPFVTIDPAGSTDLDQAVHLERAGDGYRVLYAIADVPAFVAPGGPLDLEAHKRGQTMYAPGGRIPLHPASISEDAASLLEGRLRSAYVWELDLDASAEVVAVRVERARIQNQRQTDYVTVQAELDNGTAAEWLVLLREVGLKRIELEAARGGASLNRPDEEVRVVDGVAEPTRYVLTRRMTLPVEDWNAQVSLMTGMSAASIMLDGGVGILRTMPPPDQERLDRFRRQVDALGIPWPEPLTYGAYLRGLDPRDPRHLAVIHAAAGLFRGAGYTPFDGEPPDNVVQAAVAAPYAHTTAPIRRLVDRYVLVICEALCLGREVPQWARDALPELPHDMASSDGKANQLERQSLDAIEAALLSSRVGEEFDAVVIQTKEHGGIIQLADPVVTADMEGSAPPGVRVLAELVQADIAKRKVLFRRSTT